MSLTGLIWLYGTILGILMTVRIFKEARLSVNVITKRFGFFFICMSIMFFCFSSSFFTHDLMIIKRSLFAGHVVMWIGFAALADVVWRVKWQSFMPRLVPLFVVMIGGAVELYMEWINPLLPKLIKFTDAFTIVQWNLNLITFILLGLFIWVLTVPTSFIFMEEIPKLSGQGRWRSFGMGFAFLLVGFGGPLSTLSHQPGFLVIAETLLALVGFVGLMIGVFSSPKTAEPATNRQV